MSRKPSPYRHQNFYNFIKWADRNNRRIELFDGFGDPFTMIVDGKTCTVYEQYKIASASTIIDFWPSRATLHVIATEFDISDRGYQRMDVFVPAIIDNIMFGDKS